MLTNFNIMKKLFYSLLFSAGMSLSLQAQENVIYYHNNNIVTTNKDSATYYMKFNQTQDGAIQYERYCMDNLLKEKGTVESTATLIKVGTNTTFYPNGNIKDVTNYVAGLPNGIQTHYYKNGNINYKIIINSAGYGYANQAESNIKYLYCATPDQKVILEDGNGYFMSFNDDLNIMQKGAVKNTSADGIWEGFENGRLAFVENYKDGNLLNGQSYGLDGKVYAYKERNKRPEPKGGIANFYSYIASSLQDVNAKDAKVMLKFIVDTSGDLKNIEVVNSSNSKLNTYAVDALKSAPRWNPALEQGKPVQVAYFMPISIVSN